MENINVVSMTANLTKDPELRHTQSGVPVCSMRVACNGRRKNGDEWEDEPGYYDITVWGKAGENCAEYLEKGRPIALQGKLRWREYVNSDGDKRQTVEIVADRVQFLNAGDGKGKGDRPPHPAESDVTPSGGGMTDEEAMAEAERLKSESDDIPF